MQHGQGLQFKPENIRPIYHALAEHQVTEASWELQELLAWLQLWSGRFVDAFDLQIQEYSLCVDWLDCRRYGHFRHGANGFGIKGEIAINRVYLHSRESWEILGTLLHELVHAWQEIHGKPGKNNYHNKEFRERARELGLIIDSRGTTQYESDSSFFALLEKYGVEIPETPPVQFVVRGRSKLKK